MWLTKGLLPGSVLGLPYAAVAEIEPDAEAAPEAAGRFGWQNLTAPSFGMNLPSARPMAALNTREPGGLAAASETRVGRYTSYGTVRPADGCTKRRMNERENARPKRPTQVICVKR